MPETSEQHLAPGDRVHRTWSPFLSVSPTAFRARVIAFVPARQAPLGVLRANGVDVLRDYVLGTSVVRPYEAGVDGYVVAIGFGFQAKRMLVWAPASELIKEAVA